MSVDMTKRDYPVGYIRRALRLLEGKFDVDVLEVGCMRMPMNHPNYLDDEVCESCCDGHSTYWFDQTMCKVWSIDNNVSHVNVAKKYCPHTRFIINDAINYAKNHMKDLRIGLLFLDAWDVDLPECAEKHLEFFQCVESWLNDDCLILIDDTDLYWDGKEFQPDEECLSGKGKLLIPYLLDRDYKIVFKGRQTLLRKKTER